MYTIERQYPKHLEEPLMSRSIPRASRFTFSCLALVTAFCLGIWPLAASAQPAAKPEAPVPLAPAPPKNPQVQPDGSVVFNLAMPNAAKVELHLEGAAQPFPMTKGAGWRMERHCAQACPSVLQLHL